MKAIAQWVHTHLPPKSAVFSDGLSYFNAIADAACEYWPTVAGPKPKDVPAFLWINTVIGDL